MIGAQELRSEQGQTAVEFALVLPLLCLLLFAAIQFGVVFNNYETLTDAARAGARQAILIRLSGGTPAVGEQAVRAAASGLDQSNLDVTVTDPDWTTARTERDRDRDLSVLDRPARPRGRVGKPHEHTGGAARMTSQLASTPNPSLSSTEGTRS